MSASNPKVIVVMPAYNASATLEKTINDIPLDSIDELILVDDVSRDDTVAKATALVKAHPVLTDLYEDYTTTPGKVLFTSITLQTNRGYGGNQKKCYETALAHGADIVVMLHPDYQYDPKVIPHLVAFIRDEYVDVMLGSRIRSWKEAKNGGMPLYKYIANRMLSGIENCVTGRVLSDWHTGMRAYRREVLEHISYQSFSDDFVFDTQALFAIIEKGYSIGEIPIPVRYFEEASSINFTRSTTYGLLTLREVLRHIVRVVTF